MDGLFWRSANSNFIDIAVLEWYKLFADGRGQHHWRKVVSDPDSFRTGLFVALRMTEAEFEAYIARVKEYRDKFVAHLDDLEVMDIPWLRVARQSAAYLFNYLRAHEEVENYFHDAPTSAGSFYGVAARQGRQVYGTLMN